MTAKNSGGLTQQAYEIIKEKLIKSTYPPNSILNEVLLANELGFSRTPTREAIIQLEKDGFLQVIPKKGIFVAPITANDIMQIFQARKEIEPVCLYMGRANIDRAVVEDFKSRFTSNEKDVIDGYKLDTAMHLYFVECTCNSYIINMMKGVFDKNTRVIINSKENKLHIEESKKEHLEILDAILADDYKTAMKKLGEHIDHCRIAALDSFYNSNTIDKHESYKKYLIKS